ncbi:MAG: hypothetical protein JKY95_16170, partial [Planctomycetaceae bacterium]|nr:hypothetical protein [Planctomycetaceae bacterium]
WENHIINETLVQSLSPDQQQGGINYFENLPGTSGAKEVSIGNQKVHFAIFKTGRSMIIGLLLIDYVNGLRNNEEFQGDAPVEIRVRCTKDDQEQMREVLCIICRRTNTENLVFDDSIPDSTELVPRSDAIGDGFRAVISVL